MTQDEEEIYSIIWNKDHQHLNYLRNTSVGLRIALSLCDFPVTVSFDSQQSALHVAHGEEKSMGMDTCNTVSRKCRPHWFPCVSSALEPSAVCSEVIYFEPPTIDSSPPIHLTLRTSEPAVFAG
jgi:hypothetical protein